MKKMIISLLVIAALLTALTLSTFATNYSDEFTRNLEDYGYNLALPDSSNGPIYVTYLRWRDTYWDWANATTSVSVPTDGTGRAFAQVNGNNGEVVTDVNTTLSNGAISVTVYTYDALYATKVGHSANRRVSGVLDTWEYWFYHSAS